MILSGTNDFFTSNKYGNSVSNLRKMTCYNPNLDLVNTNACTCGKLCQQVLKILSRNDILNENQTSVKDNYTFTVVRKMMCNKSNLDLVTINAQTQFVKIL